jgi:hypothetical protein
MVQAIRLFMFVQAYHIGIVVVLLSGLVVAVRAR